MRKFSKEFKKEAVRLVLSGRSQQQVRKDLGIGSSTLSKWVKEMESNEEPESEVVATAAEVRRLKKQLAEVMLERDILKKATAYFSRSFLPDISG
jgi:transposase